MLAIWAKVQNFMQARNRTFVCKIQCTVGQFVGNKVSNVKWFSYVVQERKVFCY